MGAYVYTQGCVNLFDVTALYELNHYNGGEWFVLQLRYASIYLVGCVTYTPFLIQMIRT